MSNIIVAIITAIGTVLVATVPILLSRRSASRSALLMILQCQLTNMYYAYEKIEEIPDYVYRNWKNLLKAYEALGGDDYVHELDKRISGWKLTKTDILKKGDE